MTEEENKKKVEDEDIDDDFDDDEDDNLDVDDINEENKDDAKKSKGGDDNHKDDDEANKKKVQDEEERARQAKLRREREAREREAREKAIEEKAYLKGQLDSTKVNTFTNEPIEDEYDLKIFTIQKQLEKEGKDPISDLPKRLAELNRSAGQKAKTEADEKKAREDAIDSDIKDFRAKYPRVDIAELLKDPDFKEYSDGRLGIKGGKSLAQIYDDFEKFKAKFVGKKEDDENDDDGKKSTPSPNGQKHKKSTYSNMSKEDKIKELKRQGLI